MVREYKAPPRIYHFPFELVMKAYHMRFPSHPLVPELVDTEVTYDYISEDESLHITERRFKMAVDAPYLVKKISGVDYVYVVSRNSLNKVDRTLLIECRNESFSSRISAFEKCTYAACEGDENATVFNQEGCLDVISFYGFETIVEKILVKLYSKSVENGKKIILNCIEKLAQDGITFVPRFVPKPDADYSKNRLSLEKLSFTSPLTKTSASSNVETIIESLPVSLESEVEGDPLIPFIGSLSLIESNGVLLLNKKLHSRNVEIPSLSCILRFLRGNCLDVNKAYESLIKHLLWRRQNNIDQIFDWKLPGNLYDYYKGCWHHHDINHSPMYIMRLGLMDIKGLMKTIGPDGFAKQMIKTCEEGIRLCNEATITQKKLILSLTFICDLEGLSLKYAWRPVLQVLLRLIEVVEANYPETLSKIILVKAPRVFTIIWSLICALIPENTKKKFVIISENCLGNQKIEDYIQPNYVPDFLGGPSVCVGINPSRLSIPKKLYLFKDSIQSDFIGCISMDDLYKRISITRSHQVEVSINLTQDEALITWDFDVLEGDVVFCLYRLDRVGSISSIVNMKIACSGSSLEPLEDISPKLYTEGSSVQGSYYCRNTGMYILHWKIDQELTKNKKAHVIYYYDVLPPNQLRSSFSSLASSLSNASAVDTFSLANGSPAQTNLN